MREPSIVAAIPIFSKPNLDGLTKRTAERADISGHAVVSEIHVRVN